MRFCRKNIPCHVAATDFIIIYDLNVAYMRTKNTGSRDLRYKYRKPCFAKKLPDMNRATLTLTRYGM